MMVRLVESQGPLPNGKTKRKEAIAFVRADLNQRQSVASTLASSACCRDNVWPEAMSHSEARFKLLKLTLFTDFLETVDLAHMSMLGRRYGAPAAVSAYYFGRSGRWDTTVSSRNNYFHMLGMMEKDDNSRELQGPMLSEFKTSLLRRKICTCFGEGIRDRGQAWCTCVRYRGLWGISQIEACKEGASVGHGGKRIFRDRVELEAHCNALTKMLKDTEAKLKQEQKLRRGAEEHVARLEKKTETLTNEEALPRDLDDCGMWQQLLWAYCFKSNTRLVKGRSPALEKSAFRIKVRQANSISTLQVLSITGSHSKVQKLSEHGFPFTCTRTTVNFLST